MKLHRKRNYCSSTLIRSFKSKGFVETTLLFKNFIPDFMAFHQSNRNIPYSHTLIITGDRVANYLKYQNCKVSKNFIFILPTADYVWISNITKAINIDFNIDLSISLCNMKNILLSCSQNCSALI